MFNSTKVCDRDNSFRNDYFKKGLCLIVGKYVTETIVINTIILRKDCV